MAKTNGLKKLDVFDKLDKLLEDMQIYSQKGQELVLTADADRYAYLVIKALERLTTLKDNMKAKMEEDLKKQLPSLTAVGGQHVKFYIKDGYERISVDRTYVENYKAKHGKLPDGVRITQVAGSPVISLKKE